MAASQPHTTSSASQKPRTTSPLDDPEERPANPAGRLVIGEAGRFPDLARTYYERVPERVYGALGELFAQLDLQLALQVKDSSAAAYHFAWLLLGRPLDRAMFYGTDEIPTESELEPMADAAVEVFLAAYGTSAAIDQA